MIGERGFQKEKANVSVLGVIRGKDRPLKILESWKGRDSFHRRCRVTGSPLGTFHTLKRIDNLNLLGPERRFFYCWNSN